MNEDDWTPELLEFAAGLLNLIGEGNSFEFEGNVYTLVPGYAEKLREAMNLQLEQAISDE